MHYIEVSFLCTVHEDITNLASASYVNERLLDTFMASIPTARQGVNKYTLNEHILSASEQFIYIRRVCRRLHFQLYPQGEQAGSSLSISSKARSI